VSKNKVNYFMWFDILDDLRRGGSMNMFGAPKYLQDNYDMDRTQAMDIFNKWVAYADDKARGIA
jgi:hypothetical protein